MFRSLPSRRETLVIVSLVVTSAVVWAVLFLRVRQYVFARADEDQSPSRRMETFTAMTLAFGFLFAIVAGAGALAAAMVHRTPELGAMSGVGVVALALGAVYISGLSRAWDA
jgi:hypothetical protein